MDFFQDLVALQRFDAGKHCCRVPGSKQPPMYDISTVETAITVLEHGGRHPFSRKFFTREEVLPGPRCLSLLLAVTSAPI
ncbi:hypothetical protein MB84_28925 (plasmid) [Pandoraea oxalativorans]|uniref:Uncharacterized protein n=1 Tax=Pandoraea oxalativorans TaxID=573737 RepID=A0A0G3IC89_9BURK|nr:hypothetical protein MB84_28925 [Pandoraea oxalativorans]